MAADNDGRRTKTAHVNMMTDTIINNIPAEGLRVVVRSVLATHPEITSTFEEETRRYVQDVALPKEQSREFGPDVATLKTTQRMVRCMQGCGLGIQSVSLTGDLAIQGLRLQNDNPDDELLAAIDGDVVQLVTAIEKSQLAAGRTTLPNKDKEAVEELRQSLIECQDMTGSNDQIYPYGRALTATSILLGVPIPQLDDVPASIQYTLQVDPPELKETFELQGRRLPRIFSGLWQMSSPSWGSAPTSKIIAQFSKYVSAGMIAFDMADHYGDAEITFGRFNSAYSRKNVTFAATKYCVFNPMVVTREAVEANVSERCRRLQTEKIDLLQFHWQFYDDPHYIDALRFLSEDKRVGALGLCNFDTEHMENVICNDIRVCSNQVQFSLIDSRPIVRMAKVCKEHDIKLLTYGTLCGGFLADKWLGQAEPDLYTENMTPSQRKYYAMIRSWGGWNLFQELLRVLEGVANKHEVGISTVAIRWVLDFPYVGAVIVGARMGVSEHADENTASLGWSLDQSDKDDIDEVLVRSNRMEVFEDMGDCGGEYR